MQKTRADVLLDAIFVAIIACGSIGIIAGLDALRGDFPGFFQVLSMVVTHVAFIASFIIIACIAYFLVKTR